MSRTVRPPSSERLCCALIVAVIPFAVSFALSATFRQPAGYAALQGVGAFAIVAVFFLLLLGWASDEELADRSARLAADLPRAEAAWRAHKNGVSTDRDVEEEDTEEKDLVRRPTLKKCPNCAEVIQAEARKCKHCGEMLDRTLREGEKRARDRALQVHVSSKSGGVAAVLEVIFGLFFQTFGIGPIYAGDVPDGLVLMFGWWFFLAIVSCLGFFTLGLAFILIPACWFLLMIISPIMAASAVSRRQRG